MRELNELTLPSQDEIVERIEKRKAGDPFGFEVNDLVNYLDFEHAKRYLKPDCTKEKWEEAQKSYPHTKEAVLKEMEEYFSFAWDKANNCRGLSATRSLMHYFAWTFALGDLEFCEAIIDEFMGNYHFYGKPILEKIGDRYGWDWRALDNGKRVNTDG